MYVCIHTYIYVHVCNLYASTYMYIYIYINIYLFLCRGIYVYMYIYTFLHVYIYEYTFAYICIHTHIYLQICIDTTCARAACATQRCLPRPGRHWWCRIVTAATSWERVARQTHHDMHHLPWRKVDHTVTRFAVHESPCSTRVGLAAASHESRCREASQMLLNCLHPILARPPKASTWQSACACRFWPGSTLWHTRLPPSPEKLLPVPTNLEWHRPWSSNLF